MPEKYPMAEERLFAGLGEVPEKIRVKARAACASERAKFAWMRLDVCARSKGGVVPYTNVLDSVSASGILRDLYSSQGDLLLRESVSALLLDARNKPLAFVVIAVGGLMTAAIEIAQVFRPAVLMPAAGLIMCHNHPSGVATPSADDIAFTKKLVEVGRLLGVKVLDHIILTEDDHFSFADRGIMGG